MLKHFLQDQDGPLHRINVALFANSKAHNPGSGQKSSFMVRGSGESTHLLCMSPADRIPRDGRGVDDGQQNIPTSISTRYYQSNLYDFRNPTAEPLVPRLTPAENSTDPQARYHATIPPLRRDTASEVCPTTTPQELLSISNVMRRRGHSPGLLSIPDT